VTHGAFQWARPPKIAHSSWMIRTPSNIQFLGPTQVYPPTGISTGSAVFAGIMIMTTNTKTEHDTPTIAIGCI